MTVKRFSRRDGGSSNDGNEQFGAVEQESFINNSSEIRKDLVAGGGIEAIVNRLSKWVVSALFGSIILLRHDGAALWAVIGSISNSALSVVLKRILNQERPATTLRSDPGMPSSHAQSISFISVFAVLSVMEWLGTNRVSLFLSGLILALGSYFIRLRVSQKLHTSSQVVVGAIVGSVFCILWYTMWNSLLREAFESSLLVQISVFLFAATFALAFAAYVVLNWFKDDR
ncbi:Phosphatidic acid phosphatase type 2/haloperoxidase [Arabidopsis suecica]|uniref:Phosphatidic acid phosphatase type 2/haloperoxidase n=1 Tax=Arabidopsis suecica TaxID=45249 RepID=A0A8T1ZZ05_ARASU|nr:Phosphatidic acid phosphatase type 2/haloperoxidase [Arabidopsis suecica]